VAAAQPAATARSRTARPGRRLAEPVSSLLRPFAPPSPLSPRLSHPSQEGALLLARAQYLNGNLDGALRKAGEILRLNPEESTAHLLICSVYVAQVRAGRSGRSACRQIREIRVPVPGWIGKRSRVSPAGRGGVNISCCALGGLRAVEGLAWAVRCSFP
jgi:hypothetical protein